jgi:signal transduction histidine kinase
MSKIEAGRMRLNQRGFDLHRMLDGLEEMFALRAEQKGLGAEPGPRSWRAALRAATTASCARC